MDSSLKKQGKSLGRKTIQGPDVIRKLKPEAIVISSFGQQKQIFDQIKHLERHGIEIRKL